MIRFTAGDIFAQPVDAIVNPVNCVGVMGRGLARQFKHRFPRRVRGLPRRVLTRPSPPWPHVPLRYPRRAPVVDRAFPDEAALAPPPARSATSKPDSRTWPSSSRGTASPPSPSRPSAAGSGASTGAMCGRSSKRALQAPPARSPCSSRRPSPLRPDRRPTKAPARTTRHPAPGAAAEYPEPKKSGETDEPGDAPQTASRPR